MTTYRTRGDKTQAIVRVKRNGVIVHTASQTFPTKRLAEFEKALLDYMTDSHPEVGQEILATKALSDASRATIDRAISTVKKQLAG